MTVRAAPDYEQSIYKETSRAEPDVLTQIRAIVVFCDRNRPGLRLNLRMPHRLPDRKALFPVGLSQ